MAKKRPGVVLYFDMAPAISKLTDSEKGVLLSAILNYGENGIFPNFSTNPRLDTTWIFIMQRMNKDNESYLERCEKSRYATYVREAEKKMRTPLTYEAWSEFSRDEQKNLLL